MNKRGRCANTTIVGDGRRKENKHRAQGHRSKEDKRGLLGTSVAVGASTERHVQGAESVPVATLVELEVPAEMMKSTQDGPVI